MMMMKDQIEKIEDASLDVLMKEYEQAARLHGMYMETGDYKKSNAQHDRLRLIYREIRKRGHDSQLLLLNFIDSNSLGVKIWSAYFALEFAPEIGEQVLSEVSQNGKGIQRLDAEMTLREWKAGNLKFDV